MTGSREFNFTLNYVSFLCGYHNKWRTFKTKPPTLTLHKIPQNDRIATLFMSMNQKYSQHYTSDRLNRVLFIINEKNDNLLILIWCNFWNATSPTSALDNIPQSGRIITILVSMNQKLSHLHGDTTFIAQKNSQNKIYQKSVHISFYWWVVYQWSVLCCTHDNDKI